MQTIVLAINDTTLPETTTSFFSLSGPSKISEKIIVENYFEID